MKGGDRKLKHGMQKSAGRGWRAGRYIGREGDEEEAPPGVTRALAGKRMEDANAAYMLKVLQKHAAGR